MTDQPRLPRLVTRARSPLRPTRVPPVHVGHRLHHLAERAVGDRAVDECVHDVLVGAGRFADAIERALHAVVVARPAERREPIVLIDFDLVRDLQDLDVVRVVAVAVGVHADDDPVARFHLLPEAVRRLGDRATEVALVDAAHAAAHLVDLVDDGEGVLLHLVGQRFDEPRTAERIDGAGDARLVGEDLLCPERDRAPRFLRRQAKRLVHRVGVQALAAAEHAGHRLVGDADDVVVGAAARSASNRRSARASA